MAKLTLRRVRGVLPLLLDLLLIVALFVLDIRDLYYKIGWIGPYDTFSFYAMSFRTFDPKPVVLAANFTADDRAVATSDRLLVNTSRNSGWPSLLANCDVFYPAGSFLFIGGMGHACTVYNHTDPDTQMTTTSTIPVLYMSASLRADSMAWAACKLLYRHRKPVICHDHIVTGFLDRYSLQDHPVSHEMMPLPFSDGENELLAVLRVIAKSEPLTRVTCVESFTYDGPGFYVTHIYGCGAPNAMDAAFVGIHATAFKDLHQDKAWLTVDTLNLMGFKYLMRQNVRSEFTAAVTTTTGAVSLTPNSRTNFSSGGSLYNLMVAIDVLLLVVSFLSSLEIAWLMIMPLLSKHLTKEEASDKAWAQFTDDYKTGFTSSLYRSRVVVLLLATTQLISWVIMLPNAIIFTWSTSSKMAKLQAYLSSLRLWVLILMLLNEIWDWIVRISESFAYHVVCYTYIASYEILAIGALVSYELRAEIFAIGNAKYDVEMQRTKDATSYVKRLTLQNAYNEALDYLFNTPSSIVWLMYKPLFKIIGWSFFFCVLLLVVRYGYYRVLKPVLLRKLGNKYAVAKVLAGGGTANAGASTTTPPRSTHDSRQYARLPLEALLNTPIRARCLVRASIDLETVRVHDKTHKTQRFILPAYFLEHGVLVDSAGQMHTRAGFFTFLQPTVKLDACMWETTDATDAKATLRKLHVGKADETDEQ